MAVAQAGQAIISPIPATAEWHSRQGSAYAEAGQWKQARDAFAKAVQMGTDNWFDYHCLALMQLALDDARGFQQTCESAFTRFGYVGTQWTCHIGPHALRDYAPMLKQLQEHLKVAPEDAGAKGSLNAMYFRAGLYEEALKNLNPQSGADNAWLYLAMTHWHLGHKDEAHRCLETFEQAFAKSQFPANRWHLKKQLEMELQEARALILR